MKRPMALIGFSYLIVLTLINFLPEEYLIHSLIISTIIFLACLTIPSLRKNKAAIAVSLTSLVACGVTFANFKINICPLENYFDKNAKIAGTIVDLPYSKNGRYHYVIETTNIDSNEVKPFKISMTSSQPLECDLHNKFYCNAYIYKPTSTYAFNSKQYFYSRGIYACAICDEYSETQTEICKNFSINYHILKLREKMLSVQKRFFSEDIANIQNGIILGEKNDIPSSVRTVFLKTGIYHILTAFGIHVSILMAAILWLLKKLRVNNFADKILSAALVLVLMALTGFTPSIMRAGIMCIIYLLALALQKKPDSINSLGIAVFLICLINPGSALSLGLWLSLLSVLGITIFSKKIKDFMYSKCTKTLKKSLLMNFLINSLSVSISASVFTAPLVALNFKLLSIIYPISNLIFLPLTAVILIFSLTLSFLGAMNFPNFVLYPLAFISGSCTKFLIKLSDFFAWLPMSCISLDYPFLKLWFAFSIITLAICILFFKPIKAALVSVISSVSILLCGIFSYQIYNRETYKVSLIDCSDGLGCVISKNNHCACVAFLGEKPYLQNFETSLFCFGMKSTDYFSIATCRCYPKEFIQNISHILHPKTFLIPKSTYIEQPNALYFEDSANSEIWGENLKIYTQKYDEHFYTKIIEGSNNFLIIPEGGDAENLPEDWKNCETLISYGLPANFEKLSFKNLIIYGPKNTVANFAEKLPPGINAYNLSYYGKLNITLKENKLKIEV